MTPKLTDEIRQALARQPELPLQVEDPVTHARYVLVRLDVFERLQRAKDETLGDPDPRDFYPSFAQAVQDDLDAPGMECYDEDAPPQKQP
ncbi:MAG: hypothetical protein JO112_20770 [Planctomycetes bacterium]|nr:hypothetical protein [Planctomycetota bacterium]